MIPSAQPNKPKSNSISNSNDHSHKNMATDDDQLSSQLTSTDQKVEPGLDKLQNFNQDIETSVGTEQEQTTPPQVTRSW